jgi:hypothetical protein
MVTSNQKLVGLCFDPHGHQDLKISSITGSIKAGMMFAIHYSSTLPFLFSSSATYHIHLSFIFQWLAIPFIQSELDKYVHRNNSTRKRADRKKVLPHGIPDIIFEQPDQFEAVDFKVCSINGLGQSPYCHTDIRTTRRPHHCRAGLGTAQSPCLPARSTPVSNLHFAHISVSKPPTTGV